MYTSILVPLDGSPLGEQALAVAALLARRSGAALDLALVHVPFVTGYANGAPIVHPALDTQSRAADQAYIQAVQERLAQELAVRVTGSVLDGPVAEALTRHGTVIKTDLVVMTTNGRGGLARMWLGSVADALIRQGTVPMLLLRPADTPPDPTPVSGFQNILIPLDGSRLAEHVLEPALALGQLMQAEYTLVQVVEPATHLGYAPQAYSIGLAHNIAEEQRTTAERYLESIANRLRSLGLQAHTRVILERQPALGLLDYARQAGMDLIALSTRGHGGILRLLVGSVADKVLRGAEIPVLIYRPDDTTEPAQLVEMSLTKRS